jgi:hypothetical protein
MVFPWYLNSHTVHSTCSIPRTIILQRTLKENKTHFAADSSTEFSGSGTHDKLFITTLSLKWVSVNQILSNFSIRYNESVNLVTFQMTSLACATCVSRTRRLMQHTFNSGLSCVARILKGGINPRYSQFISKIFSV